MIPWTVTYNNPSLLPLVAPPHRPQVIKETRSRIRWTAGRPSRGTVRSPEGIQDLSSINERLWPLLLDSRGSAVENRLTVLWRLHPLAGPRKF